MLQTFDVAATLSGHSDGISYCAWSPDDSMLLTCSSDSDVRLWDPMVSQLFLLLAARQALSTKVCISLYIVWWSYSVFQETYRSCHFLCLVTRWRTFHNGWIGQVFIPLGKQYHNVPPTTIEAGMTKHTSPK